MIWFVLLMVFNNIARGRPQNLLMCADSSTEINNKKTTTTAMPIATATYPPIASPANMYKRLICQERNFVLSNKPLKKY